MTPPTVALDPGSRYAGIVRLDDAGELVTARVLDRERVSRGGTAAGWRTTVLDAVTLELVAAGRAPHDGPALDEVTDLAVSFAAGLIAAGQVIIGVEDVVAPTPHGGRVDGRARVTNVAPLLEVAKVVGALEERWPAALVVRPARHGSSLDGAYPAGIRKGTRGLGGPPEHARSAYDVAHAARLEHRLLHRAVSR